MSESPNKNGRQSGGKFGKGNQFGGRTPGSRNKTTIAVEALLQGEHEALTRKAIEQALDGDTVALRLCLDRIAPARKDSPITFAMPKVNTVQDALEASGALLAAVAEGDVTPDEAGRVMALLTAHKSLIEVGDIEARLSALEQKGNL